MFDGKIARTKKNRTDDEKLFGVQIDSLCDVVCFGVFPAVICYVLGVRGILGTIVLAYYCVCSVIRLGFFNVLETNRQRVEEGANKYYHGLPITTMAIVLPLAFMLNFVIAEREFSVLLLFVLAVVGTLFIVDFKLRKPSNAFSCSFGYPCGMCSNCNLLILKISYFTVLSGTGEFHFRPSDAVEIV